jgi:hypothetical protein
MEVEKKVEEKIDRKIIHGRVVLEDTPTSKRILEFDMDFDKSVSDEEIDKKISEYLNRFK